MKKYILKIQNDGAAPLHGTVAEFLRSFQITPRELLADLNFQALGNGLDLVKDFWSAWKNEEYVLSEDIKIGQSGSHIWIHDNNKGERIAMLWIEEAAPIYCENCEKKLDPIKAVWLELSNTDGKYYTEIPEDHVSQGCFSFGSACAKKELKK